MRPLSIKITAPQFVKMWETLRSMKKAKSEEIADEAYSILTRYMSIEDMSNLNQYLGAFREFEDMVEIVEEEVEAWGSI